MRSGKVTSPSSTPDSVCKTYCWNATVDWQLQYTIVQTSKKPLLDPTILPSIEKFLYINRINDFMKYKNPDYTDEKK